MNSKSKVKKNENNFKKKAFTLIELLAVIIILGILLIIAVPAVTKYINDSRKSSYINTAKRIVEGTITLANSEKLNIIDSDTTYYIPASYIKTENTFKSPYGKFTEAYVGVVINSDKYEYFWISTDTTGTGIKYITSYDELDIDDIKNNLKAEEIRNTIETTGINGRTKIKIFDPNTENWDYYNTQYSFDEGVTYQLGKNKSNSVIGDIVKIGDEEFYVIGNDSLNNNLILFAQHNLKVGNRYTEMIDREKSSEYKLSDEGYGLQSEEAKGRYGSGEKNGTIAFSQDIYWYGKVGNNKDYFGSYEDPNNYPYVYDSNSSAYPYVENYRKYLESLGVKIKEARLIKYSEYKSISNRTELFNDSSYWLGTARNDNSVFCMRYDAVISNCGYHFDYNFGVRPVIVI